MNMNDIPDLRKIDVKEMPGDQMRFWRNLAIELHDNRFLKKLNDEVSRYYKYDY